MDINDLRSAVTVLGFLLFLGLVARTWAARAKPGHDQACRLVFEGDPTPDGLTGKEPGHG